MGEREEGRGAAREKGGKLGSESKREHKKNHQTTPRRSIEP